MHEISIAESIVELAERNAREQDGHSIQLIKLRLGEFTTIVSEALQFAFEIARQGTMAAQAVLEIESVPMIVCCVVCKSEGLPVIGLCLICGQCGFPLKIISGEELQIEYIEVRKEEKYLHGAELTAH
jgi:hydrogenase nickel incorporation protein HypA/HybF